ncbi:hypothetical protein [Burkholderia pseudomultivorans]|uniref:hypothetical protein n=1 Tax=Burkholderia pseudomultivorans TaxID=1207504 RepID=UPI00158A5D8D|nr:hypothetical protein [Burkholderia pseudomultivorans]
MNTESSHDAPSDWMIHSRIKGLVALVVGAGSGMGEASAKTFAANGGAVAVADLNAGHAERVPARSCATAARRSRSVSTCRNSRTSMRPSPPRSSASDGSTS